MSRISRPMFPWLRGACAAALVCGLATGCAAGRSGSRAEVESRRLAEQARESVEAGDLARARELLARAVAVNPQDAELHRERARLMLCEGHCDAAVEHLEYAALQEPEDAAVFVELAAAHALRQHWTAARRSIDKALDRDPGHGPALLFAAELAERSGDDAEALALYHRALKGDPQSAPARLGIASVYLRRQRLARAAPLLRAVGHDVQASPADRARAFRELGIALARQERWADALQAFDSVVELATPPTADDWHRLADARSRQGDLDGARQALEQALALDRGHAAAAQLAAALGFDPSEIARAALPTGHTTGHTTAAAAWPNRQQQP